jgi:hypothetical protein
MKLGCLHGAADTNSIKLNKMANSVPTPTAKKNFTAGLHGGSV